MESFSSSDLRKGQLEVSGCINMDRLPRLGIYQITNCQGHTALNVLSGVAPLSALWITANTLFLHTEWRFPACAQAGKPERAADLILLRTEVRFNLFYLIYLILKDPIDPSSLSFSFFLTVNYGVYTHTHIHINTYINAFQNHLLVTVETLSVSWP